MWDEDVTRMAFLASLEGRRRKFVERSRRSRPPPTHGAPVQQGDGHDTVGRPPRGPVRPTAPPRNSENSATTSYLSLLEIDWGDGEYPHVSGERPSLSITHPALAADAE